MTRDAFSSNGKTHLSLRYKYEVSRNFGLFKHEKRYSKSTSNGGLFIYYTDKDVFSKISDHFSKISKDFPKIIRRPQEKSEDN